jgi:hypothetical protein
VPSNEHSASSSDGYSGESYLSGVLDSGEGVVWRGTPLPGAYAWGGGGRYIHRLGLLLFAVAAALFAGSLLLSENHALVMPLAVAGLIVALPAVTLALWPLVRAKQAATVRYTVTAKRAVIAVGKPGAMRVDVFTTAELRKPVMTDRHGELGTVLFLRKWRTMPGPRVADGFYGINKPIAALDALTAVFERNEERKLGGTKHVTLFIRGAQMKARMTDSGD